MIKKIRYIVFMLLSFLIVSGASAQHYVGVRGGYGSGSSNLYPPVESLSVWGLYNGGFSWKYFTAEKFAGGIEVDLLFMQQAFKYERAYDGLPGDTTTTYSRKVNSIMLPLFWHPHVYLFGQQLRIFGNAGLTLSCNISQTYAWHSKIEGGVVEKGKYDMILIRDNRWGYGLCGGVGAGWSFGRFEVIGEWRYYFGYADIMKNRNKYTPNDFLRSPLNGMQFSFGVYYRLGKGGILSKPSERTAEKIRLREERRRNRAGAGESFLDGTAVIL